MDIFGAAADHDRAPSGVVTIDLPSTADAAGIARRFVDDNHVHLAPDVVDDAKLLVSEIVTNAVLHGQPPVTLALRVDPPGLGVMVVDAGGAQPDASPARPDPSQQSGRGLLIVAALASAWGISPTSPPPGKAVWFELRSDAS